MRTPKNWFQRLQAILPVVCLFLILAQAIAFAEGDPFDNFLTNAAVKLQAWGTKAGVLYLTGAFAAIGWAAKEQNPEMRSSGWRHVLAAITTIVGCQAAPALAEMVKGWAN